MLRFLDSFDHYTAAQRLAKYPADIGGGTRSIITGRNASAMRFSGNTEARQRIDFNPTMGTVIFGCAFRHSGISRSDNDIIRFYESGTIHVCILIDTSFRVNVCRGSTSTILATSTEVLTPNVWYYLEVKVTISDTGSFTVRLNEAPMTNLNGVSADTKNGLTGVINQIGFGIPGNNASNSCDYDDLYVCDGTGSTNNDFLGDVRVDALLPNANGTTSGMSGSDGNSVDNYLLVDEATPNDDTDYVESSTVSTKDTYGYSDPPVSGTVYGVQVLPYARKTDAGGRAIRSLARLSGTEVDNGADLTLGSAYLYLPTIYETKPGGGSWATSDVASAEFGVKVTV